MTTDILYTVSEHIAILAFNRPDKKNAITVAMYAALADHLQAAAADDSVRVIIIRGEGGAFTAGNDLKDFLKSPPVGDASPVVRFMTALKDMPKPVIASVNGAAVGIGTTLLMHCDLVYAADNAHFAMPFAQLGLCSEFASSVLLPRLAGYHRAAEMLLLGEPFSTNDAQAIGLVNDQLAPELLDDFVMAKAKSIAALPADSLRTTKRLMKSAFSAQVDAVMQIELAEFSRLLRGPDAKEAFAAFLEKRAPHFF